VPTGALIGTVLSEPKQIRGGEAVISSVELSVASSSEIAVIAVLTYSCGFLSSLAEGWGRVWCVRREAKGQADVSVFTVAQSHAAADGFRLHAA